MKMRRQCGKVINDAFRQHLLVSVSAGQNDIQKLCVREIRWDFYGEEGP